MTGLSQASWAASRALARGDLDSYDRAFKQAQRAATELASDLGLTVSPCVVCGDPRADLKFPRCAACRALLRFPKEEAA